MRPPAKAVSSSRDEQRDRLLGSKWDEGLKQRVRHLSSKDQRDPQAMPGVWVVCFAGPGLPASSAAHGHYLRQKGLSMPDSAMFCAQEVNPSRPSQACSLNAFPNRPS